MLFGEAPGLARHAGWLWLPLGVLLMAPWPMFQMPLPERGLPIFWLCLAGAMVIAAIVARVSWPLAALFVWSFWRPIWNGIEIHPTSL
ncbi:MAG: hypothetical protein AAB262_14995, partial [Elusimicrobiota bacterium]